MAIKKGLKTQEKRISIKLHQKKDLDFISNTKITNNIHIHGTLKRNLNIYIYIYLFFLKYFHISESLVSYNKVMW